MGFADDLESIARELRRQADTGLQRELDRAFRDAVTPVTGRIREELRPRLPDRYADVLGADLRLGVSVRTSRNPGVSLTASTRKRRSLRRLDAGRLDHPVHGHRDRWARQAVTPGWFTGPPADAEPEVARELEAALERVADAIDRKAASRGG